MELSKKLTLLRKKNGLSQLDLAEQLNVSRQAVSRWEVGSSIPNMDNLTALSKLYKVSVEEIISTEDPKGAENAEEKPEAEGCTNETITTSRKKRIAVLTVLAVVLIGVLVAWRYFWSEPVQELPPITHIDDMKSEEIQDSEVEIVY